MTVTTPPVKKRGVPVTGWLLFLGSVVGSLSASPWGAVPLNGAAASLAVASPATASPIDREGAFRVLASNIAHYRSVFEQGQAIIGHTQYANGEEGLVAMEDPNSATARFRDYCQNLNPALDMTFLDAFRRADKAFTVRHETQAIRDWLDHMSFNARRLGPVDTCPFTGEL